MRFVSIVGARPQFIKAAPLSACIRKRHEEFLIHTGQHYDDNMSDVFFRELEIPAPSYYLGVGSGSHGAQTAAMLERIERVLQDVEPDAVIVFGDTNSTLAGALAAAKMQIPVAHIEAGLRSFNSAMPEEINRRLTDHVSRWLFAPSATAVHQLATEGITAEVYQVGDIMYDAVQHFCELARRRSVILERLKLTPRGYYVATVHRASNTDSADRLSEIVMGLRRLPHPVVFPVHPRTAVALQRHGLGSFVSWHNDTGTDDLSPGHVIAVEPLGYLDMLQLQENSVAVITDSGGVQKEAYYLGVPCVTLREETEWTETVVVGWNRLAGTNPGRIVTAVTQPWHMARDTRSLLYGDGQSAERIVRILDGCPASGGCCPMA